MEPLFSVSISLVFSLEDGLQGFHITPVPPALHPGKQAAEGILNQQPPGMKPWPDVLPPDGESTELCHEKFLSFSLSFLWLLFHRYDLEPGVFSWDSLPPCPAPWDGGVQDRPRISYSPSIESTQTIEKTLDNQSSSLSNYHSWLCDLGQVT